MKNSNALSLDSNFFENLFELENTFYNDPSENAINEIIEQLSVSNIDEHRIEIIDQLVQICNSVLDQICMNLVKEVL